MKHAAHVIVAALLVAAMPLTTIAQTKDQVRNQGKEYAAKLRALGEPRDRCSMGASLAEGPVVIRTAGTSALVPGDKLVALNGTSTVGMKVDDVMAILRSISHTAVLPITVERAKERQNLSVICSNSRPTMESAINALDLAARGKFDECVAAIGSMSYIDTSMAALRAQCASVSKNSARYDVPALVVEVMEMAIEDARYAVGLREEVAKSLHGAEATITQG